MIVLTLKVGWRRLLREVCSLNFPTYPIHTFLFFPKLTCQRFVCFLPDCEQATRGLLAATDRGMVKTKVLEMPIVSANPPWKARRQTHVNYIPLLVSSIIRGKDGEKIYFHMAGRRTGFERKKEPVIPVNRSGKILLAAMLAESTTDSFICRRNIGQPHCFSIPKYVSLCMILSWLHLGFPAVVSLSFDRNGTTNWFVFPSLL